MHNIRKFSVLEKIKIGCIILYQFILLYFLFLNFKDLISFKMFIYLGGFILASIYANINLYCIIYKTEKYKSLGTVLIFIAFVLFLFLSLTPWS